MVYSEILWTSSFDVTKRRCDHAALGSASPDGPCESV